MSLPEAGPKGYLLPEFFSSKTDFQELGLLLVLVAVAILTYSSLVYFAERDKRVTYHLGYKVNRCLARYSPRHNHQPTHQQGTK